MKSVAPGRTPNNVLPDLIRRHAAYAQTDSVFRILADLRFKATHLWLGCDALHELFAPETSRVQDFYKLSRLSDALVVFPACFDCDRISFSSQEALKRTHTGLE